MRLALIGDGDSPHLLKWARALAAEPGIELWAASSRGFLAGFDAVISPQRRLALGATPRHAGGNFSVLRHLPALGQWLRAVDADWLHAHYLTSHGTLAWLARRLWRLRARLVGSAWGSDILVAPQSSWALRALTSRVLAACAFTTSDSAYMAQRMRALGAAEVMVFPFGLQLMPPAPGPKQPALFFTNRGLEPIYAPQRVLDSFAALDWPEARLVVANQGSLLESLRARATALRVGSRIQFVGRLDADAQDHWYAQAQWFFSLPQSDSVSVSVLEAMAHGCIPLLSDLPANHELIQHGSTGLILGDGAQIQRSDLQPLLQDAEAIARQNRDWVATHGLFAPAVQRFVARLRREDRV